MKLDKIEQDIENNMAGYKKVSTKNKEKIDAILKKAKEKKSINLRVNSHDLELLKQKTKRSCIR